MDVKAILRQLMSPVDVGIIHRALRARRVEVSISTLHRWRRGGAVPSWLLWPHLIAVLRGRPPALITRAIEAYAAQSPEPSIAVWSALSMGPTNESSISQATDLPVDYVLDTLHRLRQRGVVERDPLWRAV